MIRASIQIPLYSIIFVLSVVGNALVIWTLTQNQRMVMMRRTVTNVHLLNLAISDLLLGLFCMPFTLVGSILRDFVFGAAMCKLIPYLQAVSVSVSAWTLVAISVERYYAICHPLQSLRWQTLSHARRVASATWIGSLAAMAPIGVLSLLKPIGQSGRYKCREEWPSGDYEKAYNVFLDVVLLVVPLVVMVTTYSRITATLWRGIRTDERSFDSRGGNDRVGTRETTANSLSLRSSGGSEKSVEMGHSSSVGSRHSETVRRSNVDASLTNKRRVIRMLFVLVFEFFVCWTPLYVLNTVALFRPRLVYDDLGYTAISLFQLVAYASSCCNPITYCFMNSKFRRSFMMAFGCTARPLPSSSSLSAPLATVHACHVDTSTKRQDELLT